MWCCVVALALASPAMPGATSPAPTPLPPSGTASSASPGSAQSPTMTPSPATSTPAAPGAPTPGGVDTNASTGQPSNTTIDPTTTTALGDRPVTPPDTDPTRFHFDGRGTIATGIGAGGRIDTVSYGDPAGDRRSNGYLVESTGTANMWVRAVGYAERQAKRGRPLFFILPDIALSFHLGGSRVGSDAKATAAGHEVHRKGTYIGQFGHANLTGGVASRGRIGGYAKGSAGARYLVGGAGPEGAYAILPFGVGGGLRFSPRPDFTLLVGLKIEAQLGLHGIGGSTLVFTSPDDTEGQPYGWSRLTQLAPGADVVLQTKTKKNIYVSWLGTADITALGREYGGQRIFGRSTLDVGIPMTPGLRLSLFGMYSGWRASAKPDSFPFAAEGQTWNNHTFLVGVGIGL